MNKPSSYPSMPVKATPYKHQRAAFEFACRMFGLAEGGDGDADTVRTVREDDPAQTQAGGREQA